MTATIHPIHDMRLTAAHLISARKVLDRPEIHTRDVQVTACQVLMSNGDWADYERAARHKAALYRAENPAVFGIMASLRALLWVSVGWLVAACTALWMVSL
jgi:hypothetical protein